jgi:hypothetical protein
MYGELHDLVDTQVEQAEPVTMYGEYDPVQTQEEENDWLHSFIAYCAGDAYALLGDLERAEMWYSRSAEFVEHPHSAISYYAKVSAKRLKELNK